jgi:uncharacterized phiE125 gp8 family phage protein
MKLEVDTAATEEPVTPADVKTRSRMSTSSEDGLLSDFIVAARQAAEAATWSRFCTQTHKAYYDNFAQLSRRLPYPPLSSVTSVKYTDTDGTLQTVSTDVWEAGEELGIGIVRLKVDQSWPTDVRSHPDSVVVEFVCGYGDASDVPLSVKAAIVLHVQAAHFHRDAMEVPKAFYDLLGPYSYRSYTPPFWSGS